MKYIWIVMIAIFYIIWMTCTIQDYLCCRKKFAKPLDHLDEASQFFIWFHIIGLFAFSLILWLYERLL